MGWTGRLRNLLRRSEVAREIEDELQFHIDERVDELVAQGLTKAEARRIALRQFGNATLLKEQTRDMDLARAVEIVLQDARYAVRSLLRTPAFTVAAVAALAVGIGAATAIFSVVDAVLLRPLPYGQPERLVVVWDRVASLGLDRNGVSPANFVDWQRQSSVFEGMDAYTENFLNLGGEDGPPERVYGMGVTASFFDTLGVRLLAGRGFRKEDAQAADGDGALPILISHGLWQRRFGGTRDIVGRPLAVNGSRREIIGVLPPDFLFLGRRFDVFEPVAFRPHQVSDEWRGRRWLTVIARLKPDVGVAQAQARMDSVTARLAEQYPEVNRGRGAYVRLLGDELLGRTRPALFLLQVAVVLVLLIAGLNVGNLQLVRALSRARELATRAALGATRLQLVRQLFAEGLLLAAAGGVVGVLLATELVPLIVSLSPAGVPRILETSVDGRVLAFSLLAAAATSMICGLAPALHASRANLRGTLEEGGRSHTAGSSRLQGALVVAQVALSLLLLVGAGLLIKSFIRLQRVDPGFAPDAAVALDLSLSAAHGDVTARARFYEQIIERVEALPGIRSAGVTKDLPLSGQDSRRSFTIAGDTSVMAGVKLDAAIRRISSGYVDAMGLKLRRGRTFAATETGVVLVNETFARRFLGGGDAIGRGLVIEDGPPMTRQIVGVLGDVKHFGLDAEAVPEIYLSHLDRPWPNMTLVVRAANGRPATLVGAIRRELATLDGDLPAANVKTIEEYLAASMAERQLAMAVLAAFAGVALFLAALGIYGVVAYTVAGRSAEIGIRMALGANGGEIARMVVRDGLARVSVGMAAGLAAAWVATRAMTRLLFEVSAVDASVFVLVTAVLTGIALLACWLPARRAARVDPLVCMRS